VRKSPPSTSPSPSKSALVLLAGGSAATGFWAKASSTIGEVNAQLSQAPSTSVRNDGPKGDSVQSSSPHGMALAVV
jgi:hypothetical protein